MFYACPFFQTLWHNGLQLPHLTVFARHNLSFKVTISSNALAWMDYQFQLIIFEIEHTFASNAEHKFRVMYLSI